jgi:hypothetical protein
MNSDTPESLSLAEEGATPMLMRLAHSLAVYLLTHLLAVYLLTHVRAVYLHSGSCLVQQKPGKDA